jgi:hypothetical protein
MAVCSRCGAQLNPQERFCGNCGLDSAAAPFQQTAVQQTAPQPVAPQQAVYVAPVAQTSSGHRCGCTARAAMGLGIGGGLLGILWGALGPYLTLKFPEHVGWGMYGTGLKAEILLVIGLVLGVLGILGGAAASKALPLARLLLVICGLGGFVVGGSWLIPGALLLVAAGLAIAAKPQQ